MLKTLLIMVISFTLGSQILIGGEDKRGSKHQAKESSSEIFVIRGIDQPILVLKADNTASKSENIMRMPDLGTAAPSSSVLEKKVASRSREKIKKLPSDKLNFKGTHISGVLRLPRVKFARAALPMELRDDAPSLDFTQKSLHDGGF